MLVNISKCNKEEYRFIEKKRMITCNEVYCEDTDKCENCIFYEKEILFENLKLVGLLKEV